MKTSQACAPTHPNIFFYTADAYLAYVGHTESMELKIR